MATAATWTVGALASGPLPARERGDTFAPRAVLTPALSGAGLFVLFYGAGLVARRIPRLQRALTEVLRFAEPGDMAQVTVVTAANSIAEELFFRGAMYSVLGEFHPLAVSSTAYTLATVPTRNPALITAAAVTGTIWGMQRSHTGGAVAPAISHLTWALLMLRFMPPLFRPRVGNGK